MQAGFAMLETGFTRAKNSCNIIMKNVMDFSIGSLCFLLVGFGLMFGATNGVIGSVDLFISKDYSAAAGDVPVSVFIAWQTVFCATSATIVSGAMAERTSFKAYLIYSAVMSALVYPISGCWIWNEGGFLADLGFHDFAGGTAVHLLGGAAAFAGAAVLGARIGKFNKKKQPRAIRGQNIPVAAIGVFILWFGWFGFNGGSVVSSGNFDMTAIGNVFLNTIISSAACTTVSMAVTWIRYGKSDITMTLNGAVAGLVAITCGADCVSRVGALIIGAAAAFVMIFGIELIEHVFKIDDPVGAISVHGFCGGFGTIMTGVLSTSEGFIYTGRFGFFFTQLLGVAAVALFGGITMTLLFLMIKHTIGIRVSKEAEQKGLDSTEHGWHNNYSDYGTLAGMLESMPSDASEVNMSLPLSPDSYKADGKIRKVVILMNSAKFEALKDALDDIDVTGMTVTHVSGCGIQRGSTDYYRGSEAKSHLLPKIKVEIVISTVPLGLLIDTVKRVLYSGNIGDGKIFVYEVENVIKIRTNEEGVPALE